MVVGFCEEGRGFQTYNSAAYLEGGVLRHLHRKLYLPNYRIYEERKHYNPGQNMRAFDTRFGRMAILICNDAWQTFLPFIAVRRRPGAHYPCNQWPLPLSRVVGHEGLPVWYHPLLRPNARELRRLRQPGRGAGGHDLTFWGYSHVVDPWGTVVAEAPSTRKP